MRKIKSKDEVIVLTGKDRGRRGEVQAVLADGRVVVSGVKMLKHYDKPNPQAGVAGGIVAREAPIEVSNVAIYNRATGKADRVGFAFVEKNGETRKVRVFKSTKQVIDID